MDEQQVIDLMSSSESEQDWGNNIKKIKATCGGYPSFWYQAIVLSGLGETVRKNWGADFELRVIGE